MKIYSLSLCALMGFCVSSCSWVDSWSEPAEPKLGQPSRDYHDSEYWNTHDIKFIVLSIPPYTLHAENLARFVNKVKAAPIKKSGNSQEEFSVAGDGVAPAKRFVLDRNRQWLLVFEDSSADTTQNITCYRRNKGILKVFKKLTIHDLGITPAEWESFSKVSSDTIDRSGLFN